MKSLERKSEKICRYNVTCENPDCKMYKKVIGRDHFNISCPICGEVGRHHTQKCRAIKGGKVRCICWVKGEWHGEKGYNDYWLEKNRRRKERNKLKANKGKIKTRC